MLQKKYDDELNDLVPFAVESWCLLCEESSSAWVCVDGCRKHSTRRGAGGRADGSLATQRRLDATGTKVL